MKSNGSVHTGRVAVRCGMFRLFCRNVQHDAAWRRKSSFTPTDACV